MSEQLRLLAALHQAEALAINGARISFCLEHSAMVHAVERGALAAAWIEKRIECDRARAEVTGMQEADRGAHEDGR